MQMNNLGATCTVPYVPSSRINKYNFHFIVIQRKTKRPFKKFSFFVDITAPEERDGVYFRYILMTV